MMNPETMIGNAGVVGLCESLMKNTTLTKIDLSSFDIVTPVFFEPTCFYPMNMLYDWRCWSDKDRRNVDLE